MEHFHTGRDIEISETDIHHNPLKVLFLILRSPNKDYFNHWFETLLFSGNTELIFTSNLEVYRNSMEILGTPSLGAAIYSVIDKFVSKASPDDWRGTLRILRQAAKCLRPNAYYLNPAHTHAVKIALENHFPAAVKELINDNLIMIEPEITGINAIYYVAYFFYAGRVHVHYREYDKAVRSFKACLDMPGWESTDYGKNACMQLSVIRASAVDPDAGMTNMIKYSPYFKEYEYFSRTILNGNDMEADQFLKKNEDALRRDNLFELCQQVFADRHAPRILKLTSVYNTLCFDDITGVLQISEEDMLRCLMSLISSERTFATVDYTARVVYFHDKPPQSKEIIEGCVSRAMDLADRLADMEISMKASKNALFNNGTIASCMKGLQMSMPRGSASALEGSRAKYGARRTSKE
eukprot:Tbor_TRINITY_DN6045_c1_g1::TRINITY_DN6045_c1_g1_i1::g.11435::m.11435/K12177/COPS3, CSN3; COP9 signalosome complex subunit 3